MDPFSRHCGSLSEIAVVRHLDQPRPVQKLSTKAPKHLHTSTHIYIHIYTSTHIYTHLHTSTHIHTYLYTSTHIRQRIHIHLIKSDHIQSSMEWNLVDPSTSDIISRSDPGHICRIFLDMHRVWSRSGYNLAYIWISGEYSVLRIICVTSYLWFFSIPHVFVSCSKFIYFV